MVHMLNAVDRLAFLQAVVQRDATPASLQDSAIELVPQSLLTKQPRALGMLTRLANYLELCLQLFRARTLQLHAGSAVDDPALARTRELAFQLAMAHEVCTSSGWPCFEVPTVTLQTISMLRRAHATAADSSSASLAGD